MPADTHPAGDIFIGWLICEIGLAAGTVAAFTSGNLRAVQLLLGHTMMDSTVRYLGVELVDALLSPKP